MLVKNAPARHGGRGRLALRAHHRCPTPARDLVAPVLGRHRPRPTIVWRRVAVVRRLPPPAARRCCATGAASAAPPPSADGELAWPGAVPAVDVKVAVYDRYWPTGGGGETFAAGVAAALAGEHDVRPARPTTTSTWRGWASGCASTCRGVGVDVLDDDLGVARASAGLRPARQRLVPELGRQPGPPRDVHRPLPGPRPGRAEQARRVAAPPAARRPAAGGATGRAGATRFYAPEATRLHGIRWTGGDGELRRVVPADGAGARDAAARALPPAAVHPARRGGGGRRRRVGRARSTLPASRLDRRRSVALRFDVDVPAGGAVRVEVRSPTWVPADLGIGNATGEPLGVPVIGVHAGGGLAGRCRPGALPVLAGHTGAPAHLDTLRPVVANSRVHPAVDRAPVAPAERSLHPPVRPDGAGTRRRDPVGRPLLPPGHRPQQEAAGDGRRPSAAWSRGGGADGWEYHLVGGCAGSTGRTSTRSRRPRRACRSCSTPTPRGPSCADLYGRASIFWHAAGLGEDPERHPDRYEHFGITTVEAMSAGAVPVVIDAAGQVEIVEQGASGYRFAELDGLVDYTRRLIADPAWRDALSAAAERRARDFGWDRSSARVRAEVAALGG